MKMIKDRLTKHIHDDYYTLDEKLGSIAIMKLGKIEDIEEQIGMSLEERAIPKKAILVHNYDDLVFECPNCHMKFRPDIIMNHVKWKGCPYCLQNLDWSE